MENRIVAKSCRVCLKKTKKLGSLYKPSDEGYQPPNRMLHLITGVIIEEMHEYETLPKSICKKCELSLNKAFIFRENALKTQQIIAAYFEELNENYNIEDNNLSGITVKSEFEDINLQPLNSVGAIKEEFQYLSDDQNKCALRNHDLNEVHSENTSEEKQQVTDDVYNQQDSAVFQNEYNEHINVKKEDIEDGLKRTVSDDDEFEYSEENFEIMPADGENYAVIQINLSKNRSAKSTKKNARRGRMIEQRKRHDKACRLICEICEKKFLTFKLLRKHMSSHCGDKPYSCEFCSRTFSSKGKHKRHQVIHGPRDYICDVCNKGFNYSHHLKRHKLTHEEIKDYRCEYCDKDFRLKHHKQKHDLTKSHQNTVRIAKLCNLSIANSGQLKHQENLNESTSFKKEIADNQLTQDS